MIEDPKDVENLVEFIIGSWESEGKDAKSGRPIVKVEFKSKTLRMETLNSDDQTPIVSKGEYLTFAPSAHPAKLELTISSEVWHKGAHIKIQRQGDGLICTFDNEKEKSIRLHRVER
jgi:hypothetical protein